jgi:hypothetical protein
MTAVKARVAAVACDKRGQWGIFAVLTGFAVVASALILTDVAGLRRKDVGLSAAWRPAAVKARIDAVLADALVKQRLAASLASANVLAAITADKVDTPFKPWTAHSAIADALTSESAQKALSSRILTVARESDDILAEAWFRLTSEPRSGPTADLISHANTAALAEISLWFDEMLPQAALESIVTEAGGIKPDEAVRQAIKKQVTDFISLKSIGERLVRNAERQLEVGSQDDDRVKAASKDFAARQAWAVAGVLFTTVALTAVFGSIARIRSLTGTVAPHVWMLIAAVAAVAGYVVATQVPNLGNPFLSGAVTHFDDLYDLRIDETSHIFNGLAAAAVIALVASSWASFLPREHETERLLFQLESLRWSVNIATLLLVVGVIEIFALLHWPSAFAGDDAATAITTAATSAAGAAGITFSLILLLIYVPGSRMLRERVAEEVTNSKIEEGNANLPQTQRDKAAARHKTLNEMLQTNGFTGSTTDQLMRFGQALLPLLVSGALPQLFSLVGTG